MSGFVEGQLVIIGPQPEEGRVKGRMACRFVGAVAVLRRPELDGDGEVRGLLLGQTGLSNFYARPETLFPLSQTSVVTIDDTHDRIVDLLTEYNRRTA